MFLRSEIFHMEGAFFDKNGTLMKFPQLCTYERYVVETFGVIWSFGLYESVIHIQCI
jgi:hypothetical protein